MKNFFTREVKIGLVFVVAAAVLFFGFNYLKGINIFTPSNHYYATYKDVGGLVVSNPVKIKGYKVGQVRSIKYDFAKTEPFVVEIAVNKDIKLPKGTILALTDEGLLGGKMIDVQLSNSNNMYKSGDFLATKTDGNLLSQIGELAPKLQQTFDNLDSIMLSIKTLVNSPSLHNGIDKFDVIMIDLHTTMAQLKLAAVNLPRTMTTLDHLATNLDNKINDLDIAKLMMQIDKTLANVNNFSEKLNNKNSTLGLLLNDRNVYDNLNTTVKSANALLVDLKQNPKRYVHFSLFGKKDKPKVENNEE